MKIKSYPTSVHLNYYYLSQATEYFYLPQKVPFCPFPVNHNPYPETTVLISITTPKVLPVLIFFINGIICTYLCLASLALNNILEIHLCCVKQQFIPIVKKAAMNILHQSFCERVLYSP